MAKKREELDIFGADMSFMSKPSEYVGEAVLSSLFKDEKSKSHICDILRNIRTVK